MPIQTPLVAPDPSYDRNAIFHDVSPLNPSFMREALRNLMRALPLDPTEPPAWSHRRMNAALIALAAVHARDELEVMLGVQAVAAYHAAAAAWYIGMNRQLPCGDSTRHIAAASTAARTFDTMLKAIERRQARPIGVPAGRPEPRAWPEEDLEAKITALATTVSEAVVTPAENPRKWTEDDVKVAKAMREAERYKAENEGLDIANTEGILPGGGMIVPEDPTPQQDAYLARRLGLLYKREWAETKRRGGTTLPKIRPIRPGDFIP
jgi:hypothetical protein